MLRRFAVPTILLSLLGCASTSALGDLALQNPDLSASLRLAAGLPPLPADGVYFAIPGHIFVAGEMIMHPGVRRIAYACPGNWEWKQITHYIPSLEYDFKAGANYEMYCIDGYPAIRPLDKP